MAQISIKEAICEAVRQTVDYIKGKAVTSEVQTFTDEEKAQIRANIGVTSAGNTDNSGVTEELNTLTNNVAELKIENKAIYGKLEYSSDNNTLNFITNYKINSFSAPFVCYGYTDKEINIKSKASFLINGAGVSDGTISPTEIYANKTARIDVKTINGVPNVEFTSGSVTHQWGANIDYEVSNLKENVTPVRKFYGTTDTVATEQIKVVTIEDTDFPASEADYYEGMRLSVKFIQDCDGTISGTCPTIKLQINGVSRYVRDRDRGITVNKAACSFGNNKYVDFIWDGIDAWVCYDPSEAHTKDMRMDYSNTKCKYNNLPATRDDVNNVYDLLKTSQFTENLEFNSSWASATITFNKVYQNVPMVNVYVNTELVNVTSYKPDIRIIGVTNAKVTFAYMASSTKSFDVKINVIGY